MKLFKTWRDIWTIARYRRKLEVSCARLRARRTALPETQWTQDDLENALLDAIQDGDQELAERLAHKITSMRTLGTRR